MSKDLDQIFRPRAIAVIGASREEGSFGHRVVRCLADGGFKGPVYPVNPKARVINTLPCYPRVDSIPGPVDLAVVVVPARDVAAVVEQCAKKGVKGLAVLSAGFREIGATGERLEQRLVELVRRNGMRMVGPNCMGVVNTDPLVRMNATFAPATMAPGGIAFLSQSGAMGVAILNYAAEINLGLSMYVSVGNKADVSANDLLEYWRDDPRTQAILLYMEGFGNPRRFTQIARTVTPEKPIIAVKAGRTASGKRAADSHTGQSGEGRVQPGADLAVDALFEQCGVIRVQTLEELFDLALAVVNQPLPAGDSVAVITNGGGPGIMASDALEGLQLEVPPLDPRTVSHLRKFLPREASVGNPVDMMADASPEVYRRAIELILADPNIDVALIIYVGFDYGEIAPAIREAAKGSTKPVLACLMGGRSADPGRMLLQTSGVPVYSFPESACRVIRHLANYRRYRMRAPGKVKRYRAVDRAVVEDIFDRVLGEGRSDLSQEEIREVARSYGARILKNGVADSEDRAAEIAVEIGFPVVVKVLAPRVRKRSDLGGVILDLRTEAEVRRAFSRVQESVRARFPSARIEGVMVQQMLKGGTELIVGAEQDQIFGPVLKLGAGGEYSDLIQDFQYRIVPITPQEAMEMIRSLKIFPVLEGTRGRGGINLGSVVDLLCRASQLIEDFEEIQEFEINPLMLLPHKKDFWAVDGKMRIGRPPASKTPDPG